MVVRTRRIPAERSESDPGITQALPDRFCPPMPDDGRELMLAWDVPADDWDKITVKTCRFKPGTQQLEVLFSCIPPQWSLETVAQRYGQGSYKILAGPGPHRGKNTTITVSREYAQEAGHESAPPMAPPMDPNQQLAARTFVQATQGPVDPLNLSQMIAAAVETAIARNRPPESGLDSFLKGFTIANDLSLKAMDQAKAMLGIQTTTETREVGWPEVIMSVAPQIIGTLQQAMSTPSPQPQRQPQQDPSPQNLQTIIQKQEPQTMAPQPPTPPQETLPLLNIMRQYAAILRQHLANPDTTPRALAEELSGLVGPTLDESVLATAQEVMQNGPGILANADAELATEKAAQTLIEWSNIIQDQTAE